MEYMNNLDYVYRAFCSDIRRRVLRGLVNSEVNCYFEPNAEEGGKIFVEIHNLVADNRFKTTISTDAAIKAVNDDDPREIVKKIRDDYRDSVFKTYFKPRRNPNDSSDRPSAGISESDTYEPEAAPTEDQIEALQRQFAGDQVHPNVSGGVQED